jgi:hypothetical protein
MRWWGYPDAAITRGGSDGGVDVQAKEALGQVKFEAVQVGRPELQRRFGARGHQLHQALFFFTGAGYSGPAIAYADEAGIALFQYSLLGAMTPMSRYARHVLRAVEDREAAAERAREEAQHSRERAVAPAREGVS